VAPSRDVHDRVVVAVDGPAGAGKSSVSRAVAIQLGLRYLDTGSMYRAATWWLLREGVDVSDHDAVARAPLPDLRVGTDPTAPTVAVGGHDVTRAVREADVTAAVSAVSAVPAVRAWLAARQRALIDGGDIVVEGRDIGTVVAPDADVKIFLTASDAARAARRAAETADADPGSTLSDIIRRDRADSTRVASPLSVAADAHVVDATELTLPEVVDTVAALVRSRVGAQA